MAQDGLFCVGQKAVIDKGGEVLILTDPLLGLDMPGGKIKEGVTDFVDDLKREVREETGLEIEVGEPFSTGYFEFKNPESKNFGRKVYLVLFKCKYISGDVKLSHEHSSFKWINKDNYKELDNYDGPADIDRKDYFWALEKYFGISK